MLAALLALLTATSAAAGVAAHANSTGPAKAGQELATVSMATVPVLAMAPEFIADDLGLWRKHGIKMEYNFVTDPYALLAVQSQGKLDVNIVATGAALFNAVNSGLNFKVGVDRLTYACSSTNLLLVRRDLHREGVRTPAALRGRRIAYFGPGTATEFWLQQMLRRNGMTMADIRPVVIRAYPDIVNALKTGGVDAGFVAQPIAAVAMIDGTASRIIGTDKITPNDESGVVTFSQEFIDRNGGATAVNWTAAWLEAVRFFLNPKNKARVIRVVAKATSVPESVVAKLYGTDQWPWMHPNGTYQSERILGGPAGLKWLLDNKLVSSIPAPSSYTATQILQRAQQKVGKVRYTRKCKDVKPFKLGK